MSIRSAAAISIVAALAAAANAGVVQVNEVEVLGTANIFRAGNTGAPSGGTLPPIIQLPAFNPGDYFSMAAVFGDVSCCSGAPGSFNGPEGGSNAGGSTNVNSLNGISGLLHNNKTMFLVGVFLSDDAPADPAPARLDFSDGNDNFPSISPLLNQSFFIGDGIFNEANLRHNEPQTFYIPAGATRLALGFVDSFNFTGDPGFYDDNVGSLTAVVGFIPTPGAASALGIAGIAALRRRR